MTKRIYRAIWATVALARRALFGTPKKRPAKPGQESTIFQAISGRDPNTPYTHSFTPNPDNITAPAWREWLGLPPLNKDD